MRYGCSKFLEDAQFPEDAPSFETDSALFLTIFVIFSFLDMVTTPLNTPLFGGFWPLHPPNLSVFIGYHWLASLNQVCKNWSPNSLRSLSIKSTKSKNFKIVKSGDKSVSEHCVSFGKFSFSFTVLRILNDQTLKIGKLIFHCSSFWTKNPIWPLSRRGGEESAC